MSTHTVAVSYEGVDDDIGIVVDPAELRIVFTYKPGWARDRIDPPEADELDCVSVHRLDHGVWVYASEFIPWANDWLDAHRDRAGEVVAEDRIAAVMARAESRRDYDRVENW